MITRQTFIDSISKIYSGQARAEWLFKPECIRNRVHENIDLIKVKEEIYTFNIDHEQSASKLDKHTIPSRLVIEEYEDF